MNVWPKSEGFLKLLVGVCLAETCFGYLDGLLLLWIGSAGGSAGGYVVGSGVAECKRKEGGGGGSGEKECGG